MNRVGALAAVDGKKRVEVIRPSPEAADGNRIRSIARVDCQRRRGVGESDAFGIRRRDGRHPRGTRIGYGNDFVGNAVVQNDVLCGGRLSDRFQALIEDLD